MPGCLSVLCTSTVNGRGCAKTLTSIENFQKRARRAQVKSMAQHSTKGNAVQWKPGTKCDFFDRITRKWIEAEVIGSFSDAKGEWTKVRCGLKDHVVMSDDPDLRKRAVIPGHELKQLQDAAAQIPNIEAILQRVLPSSSGQGLYTHSDGLFKFPFIY